MSSNKDIMNLVRSMASTDFKERIPVVTQENMTTAMEGILEYPNVRNEFIEVLTNKVAKEIFFTKVYENPFKFFKKGDLPYGKTIEGIFVDLIQAKSFEENFGKGDSEATSLLSKEKCNVKVEYYSENFKHKYKMTISNSELKGAFYSEGGLQRLINKLVISPTNSAEHDEFLLMKNLICNTAMKEHTIEGYKTLDEDKQAKKLTKVIKTKVAQFKFLGNKFNRQKVMTFTNPSEVVIFVTPETKSNLDVELLASAFHLNNAEMEGRLLLIDEFITSTGEVDNDTIAVVADENILQFYDTEKATENFRNGDKLYTNTFHHRWGIACSCGFVNAIKIKQS